MTVYCWALALLLILPAGWQPRDLYQLRALRSIYDFFDLYTGQIWSCSWNVFTTRTRRWRPTGPSQSPWASTLRRSWSSAQDRQELLPINAFFIDLCRSKTSVELAETPSRSQSPPAAASVSVSFLFHYHIMSIHYLNVCSLCTSSKLNTYYHAVIIIIFILSYIKALICNDDMLYVHLDLCFFLVVIVPTWCSNNTKVGVPGVCEVSLSCRMLVQYMTVGSLYKWKLGQVNDCKPLASLESQ